MFWPDVADIRKFYGTALGQVCLRSITRKIRIFWPDCRGETIIGLGYASPYLNTFQNEAKCMAVLMPAAQGVLHWPGMRANLAALTHEDELPLSDASVDKVVIIHALEHTQHAGNMIEEAWRILSPGGKLLLIAPNRGGLWARLENNPFGFGVPYSGYQGSKILTDAMFSINNLDYALYCLPTQSRNILKIADFLERIGSRFLKPLAGVIVIEAEKQVYSLRPIKAKTSRISRLIYVPAGAPQPA